MLSCRSDAFAIGGGTSAIGGLLALLTVMVGAPLTLEAQPLGAMRSPSGGDTTDVVIPHRSFTRTDGLPHEFVLNFEQGPDGRLWIGTIAGLAVYDGHEMQSVGLPDSLANETVCTVFAQETETVWASLNRVVVALRNGQVQTVVDIPPGIDCFREFRVRGDTLRAVGRSAIWTLPPEASKFTQMSYSYRASTERGRALVDSANKAITKLKHAPDGTPWVLDAQLGPGRLGPDGTVTFANAPLFAEMRGAWEGGWEALQLSRDGPIFVAGEPGFYAFDPASGAVRKRSSIPYEQFESHKNVVYGVHTDHVQRWNRRTGDVQTLGPSVGLPDGQYHTVLRDDWGGLWIGTQQGLLYLPAPDVRSFTAIDGVPIHWTTDLAAGPDREEVWLSTWGEGLFRLAPAPTHAIPAKTLDARRPVDRKWTLGMRHRSGSVDALNQAGWFRRTEAGWRHVHPRIDATHGYVDTTGAGVFWTDHGICRVPPTPSAPVDTLWHWDRDEVGRHRFSALGDGTLLLRTRGHLVHLSPYAPSEADTVASFPQYADVRTRTMTVLDDAWLGTWSNGLVRVDWRGDTTRTSRLLPTHRVHPLTTAGDSLLLAGTKTGLYLVDPTSESVRRRLTTADGLLSNSAWGRLFRDTLYVRHLHGVTMLPRRAVQSTPRPPRPVITRMLANGEAQPLTDPTRLAVGERTLRFRFAGVHLARGAQVRHAYRLVPHDTTWHVTDDRRTRYTDLPPGSYTFKVRARLDGAPATEPATLHVTLPPAFYETTWFWWLCSLAGVGLLVGGYAWRVRRLRRRQEELQSLVAERTRRLAEEKEKTEAQAERLATLDEEKNRFFANISHELRTPLTVLRGTVQDALGGAFGDVPAPLRQQLETMCQHVGRLRRLANQLLDLSRLETTELGLDPEPRDLVAFVRSLVEAHAPMADRRGIRLDATMGPDAHPCRFDPEKLETALGNLLANALQYTPRGGTVTIRLEVAPPSEPEAPPTAIIVVEDTGRGISPDQQDQIFERFARPTPPDGDESGTGIGLALVREHVQLHDGSIALDSTPGEGSTFTVRLPLPPAEPHEVPSSAQPSAGSPPLPRLTGDGVPASDADRAVDGPDGANAAEEASRRTLLVAEDNADVRAYLRRHFAPHWTVQEAADGAEALDCLRTAASDLVLADVMMPELDGLELTRRLRADEDLDRIPIVLLTARADEDDAVAGLEAGADDYVTKPFSIEELRARIEQLFCARQAWTDAALADRLLAPDVEMTTADEAFLDRVTTALDEHLSRASLTVDDLAAEVGLSPRQLQRRLKQLTGCTAAAFVRRYRVECAAALLEEGAQSISQVAYRVGFGTPETFAKHFREHFDCAPSTYARRHDAGPSDAPT